MNDSENRNREMFARVNRFGDDHHQDFITGSLGQQTFASLKTILAELDGHATTELSSFGSAREGTTTRAQAREALREDLEAIARTAEAMSDEIPGLEDKFKLPVTGNDQRLLTAGRAFAVDAAPLAAQFIAHELPADFLTDLQDDIAALENAIGSQASGVGGHVAAKTAIDSAIARGNETVRKLNAIVRNKYANRPDVLAEWTSASHTERAPRRKKSASPQTPATGGTPPPA